ncbi:MAG TPA: response regulator transcription factor [Burkholderiaceae bacterium]|nr:response regulator transcription factor [Burkholderiaceae bacterium]
MSTDPPIRVLLVDDHQTMLWGLRKLIESEGSTMQVVGCAADCDGALAQARSLAPDVIVLDLDLDGTSSLGILADLVKDSGARVLVLSGTREPSQLDAAVLHGARGVVGKDAAADIVLQAIRKLHQGELWLEQSMLGRIFDDMRNPPKRRQTDPGADKIATLTTKERQICDLIAAGGGGNKTLAQTLFISDHTLRNHLTSIYHKLGVTNRLDLYVFMTTHRAEPQER